MSKIIVMPSSKEEILDLLDNVDGFIIGLKDMSINMPTYFSLFEIKEINEILKEKNKKVFVSLNRNMHNKDLDYLKEVLIEFENMKIDGIFYYDVSLINLKQEMNLRLNLVFSEEHSVTNYATINYWNMMGAEAAYLSNEITLDEIIEIKRNSNSSLFVQVFGYVPIFASERKLITNYLKQFDLESTGNKYYIEKENKKYRILENKYNTEVYSNYILNAIDEIKKLNEEEIEYLVFNSFDIDKDIFKHIIKNLNDIDSKEVDEMLENTDKGFLYKETIYKVKNYE